MRDRHNSEFLILPRPRAIGHRGSAGTHPENTLVSFQAAVDCGARYLELDVHMTRDGEIVVSHDEELSRACGRDAAIRHLSYAELASADAGHTFTPDERSYPFRGRGIAVPLLADVFAAFPAIRVVVEVKQTEPSLVAPMLQVIDRAGMREMVMVASEHQKPLDEIRALAPGIPTNFCYGEVAGFLQAMVAKSGDYAPPAQALQIPPVYESWQMVTAESVGFAHQLGVEVHVWTVNDAVEMNRLLDLGVDGIISDYPARLIGVIESRAQRAQR
ncbi:MAG TPA: glycerophosphodiester phosphodiesterase [Candidatus Binataceae bacterium]